MLHVKAHQALKFSRTFLFSLFSCLICQHYLSLLTWISKSFWCLPSIINWFVMTSVSHSSIPLFRKRMQKRGRNPPGSGEVIVRSFKQVALLLEKWWHALFTTRTDMLPLFCFCLGEESISRWFSRDSIKIAYTFLKWFTDTPFGEDKWWHDLHWEALKLIQNALSLYKLLFFVSTSRG